jgi:talin
MIVGKWLGGDKSLVEQGVPETDILLLKKKFFYSDQNIDPVQLNLLYVQSRDSIIHGKLPCTLQEAVQLAAIQVQIQHGNHDPDRHRPGFLEYVSNYILLINDIYINCRMKQFLPAEYLKDKKSTEKLIYAGHKKLYGMNELNAKYRYHHNCSCLRTYGFTFYAVKERDEKSRKEKWVPIFLGISRDAIIRMDPETKEILKTWPLINVRRWFAAQDAFTLDLGDYADNYYVVKTREGDAISQQVSGYIDIILKRRKESEAKSKGSTSSLGAIKGTKPAALLSSDNV